LQIPPKEGFGGERRPKDRKLYCVNSLIIRAFSITISVLWQT
jgi:hypothetical protein